MKNKTITIRCNCCQSELLEVLTTKDNLTKRNIIVTCGICGDTTPPTPTVGDFALSPLSVELSDLDVDEPNIHITTVKV